MIKIIFLEKQINEMEWNWNWMKYNLKRLNDQNKFEERKKMYEMFETWIKYNLEH